MTFVTSLLENLKKKTRVFLNKHSPSSNFNSFNSHSLFILTRILSNSHPHPLTPLPYSIQRSLPPSVRPLDMLASFFSPHILVTHLNWLSTYCQLHASLTMHNLHSSLPMSLTLSTQYAQSVRTSLTFNVSGKMSEWDQLS